MNRAGVGYLGFWISDGISELLKARIAKSVITFFVRLSLLVCQESTNITSGNNRLLVYTAKGHTS